MSQLMKRQLEHQSSAPHNICTWETGKTLHTHFFIPLTSESSCDRMHLFACLEGDLGKGRLDFEADPVTYEDCRT